MILQDAFTVEPWNLRETQLDLDLLAQTESVFALANGHLGWRANLDEGEPHGLPGSYLNGVYESRPLPYAESAYGLPESGEEVINVTNGKVIRLFVDDEPFDVRDGELRSHERRLDFRTGVLTRSADWVSPAGRRVRVSSDRMVSLTQRAVAAICYEVEPLNGPARISVHSELIANEQLPAAQADPRLPAPLENPLGHEYHQTIDTSVLLMHKTMTSGLRVAAVMDHLFECPAEVHTESWALEDNGLVSATTVLRPGQKLRVIKFVAYGWSRQRSLPAVRDQVWAALRTARLTGWNGLLAEQRAYLDDFWDRADVEVDGDAEVQQAVRFGLFHVLQAGARAEDRAIPAKGLTGPGYGGHAFWDSETFVLPMLSFIAPSRPRRRFAGGTARFSTLSTAPPSWACRARPSRGGRSPAGSALATGPLALPLSTSTLISRWQWSGTSTPPATRSSLGAREWTCSSTLPGCGAHLAATTPTASSISTASRVRTSTAPSPTTTSIQT